MSKKSRTTDTIVTHCMIVSFYRREMGILNQQLGYKREFPEPNLIRITIPTLPYEGLDYTGMYVIDCFVQLLEWFDRAS